ncbi:MAG: biotin/lipoyl-binding carrier protein [Betaproteobacteria bacterium]|nr:biotin/lipoyl-binding carrier protein [Betaproteobacteria bacterium]OGA33604.1 MAG: acetyl-CoA carboxylase biotin carboxyl carrier protein subunit [Betaproteobacteria bacterium RIFCSPLOWO2_12_FULL_64_23]
MPSTKVVSDIAGRVWKIEAAAGTRVAQDDALLILESMKMEIPVNAPRAGTVIEIYFTEGEVVGEGDVVALIE